MLQHPISQVQGGSKSRNRNAETEATPTIIASFRMGGERGKGRSKEKRKVRAEGRAVGASW